MKCELLETTTKGQKVVGVIDLQGTAIVPIVVPGYERTMASVLSEKVVTYDKSYTKESDPVAWFTNLPKQYTGSYFRARIVNDGAILQSAQDVD